MKILPISMMALALMACQGVDSQQALAPDVVHISNTTTPTQVVANTATYIPSVTPSVTTTANPASTSMPIVVANWPLNDSGQNWCAAAENLNQDCSGIVLAGQDGHYGRDAAAQNGSLIKSSNGGGNAGFDFTKLDEHGNELDPSASGHSCVRDNVTGLIWEVKTNDGGMRDGGHIYSWYNPDGSTNGGHAGTAKSGTCVGSDCDTFGYMQAVNALSAPLCGFNDWRVPSTVELLSIADFAQSDLSIDVSFFPNTLDWGYWSSQSVWGFEVYAHGIHFGDGAAFSSSKSFDYGMRLVRSEATNELSE